MMSAEHDGNEMRELLPIVGSCSDRTPESFLLPDGSCCLQCRRTSELGLPFTSTGESAEIPDSLTPVMEEVLWGRPDILFTPAYWAMQVHHWGKNHVPHTHRLGRSLRQEVVACMLGGHGIPSDVALAAFRRLRAAQLLDLGNVDTTAVIETLSAPLDLGNGRRVRYRFARLKGKYVADLLNRWRTPPRRLNGRAMRNWLLQFR